MRRLICCVAALVLLLPALSACGTSDDATLTGYLYGQALAPEQSPAPAATATPSATPTRVIQAPDGAVPVKAQVICNGVKASTDAKGIFMLHAKPAKSYSCTATSASYQDFAWTVEPVKSARHLLILFNETITIGTCGIDQDFGATACPILKLKTATLSGVVHDSAGKPLGNQEVHCGRVALPTDQKEDYGVGREYPMVIATTDAAGHYTVKVRPGVVRCYALNSPTLSQAMTQPGGTATLDLPSCATPCGTVTYHDGKVMHSVNVYIIFWLPPGKSFESGGTNDRFESLMKGYFSDVNGSGLYHMMGQYGDFGGLVTPNIKLASTYIDTNAYTQPGTRARPLQEADITSEVYRIRIAQQWPTNDSSLIALFTANGIEACSKNGDCTFGNHGFCAFHSAYYSFQDNALGAYMYIPVAPSCVQDTYQTFYGSPHGDPVAEASLDFLSHEHFEAITDPFGDGWFGSDQVESEVGDLCETTYGNISHSSNVSLNGHPYLIQTEWSAKDNGCRFG